MEISERIQALRKEKGLSQEELAKKLLVSRQTVSQWETGQTVPSLDNIYRLKDIFEISFEKLMTADATTSAEDHPLEEFSFDSTKESLISSERIVWSKQLTRSILFVIISTVLFLISVTSNLSDPAYTVDGACSLLFGISVTSLIRIIVLKGRSRKNALRSHVGKTSKFKVYDNKIIVTSYSSGELSRLFTINKGEILSVLEDKEYLIFMTSANYFILRKEDVKSNSYIHDHFPSKVKSSIPKSSPVISKILSVVLFIASISSIYIALICLLYISDGHNPLSNMWILYIFALIPLASLVFGIIERKRKNRNTKNIVIGAIFLSILCLLGSFTFIFKGFYDSDYTLVSELEDETGIDFPDNGNISTTSFNFESMHSQSDVYFTENVAEEFISQIKDDERWLSTVPTVLQACLPYGNSSIIYDYSVIYNRDTKAFNEMPTENKTYSFVHFGYDTESGLLRITEYSKEIILSSENDNLE